MAAEPAADPVALAAAANPLAPIEGTTLPKVGAKAPNPCAIAGAARPVKNHKQLYNNLLPPQVSIEGNTL